MIRMERIDVRNTRRITYRGTLTLVKGRNDPHPVHIQEQDSVETPNGYSQAADRQCMNTVVRQLVRMAEHKILESLSEHFILAGTFDTTAPDETAWRVVNITPSRGMWSHKQSINARKGSQLLTARFSEDSMRYLEESGILNLRERLFYLERLPQTLTEESDVTITTAAPLDRFEDEIHTWTVPSRHVGRSFLRETELSEVALEEMRRLYNDSQAAFLNPSLRGTDIRFKAFRKAKRDTPDRRAMALLARRIGRDRYRSLKKNGYFEEQGKHGLYQFHKDKQGGVVFLQKISVGGLKERTVSWDLCVQSQAPDLPNGDVILTRWMEWKADEDRFLETANFRNIRTADEAKEMPVDVQNISDALLRAIHESASIPRGMMGMVDMHPRS